MIHIIHLPFFSRNENIHFLARAEGFRAPVLKFGSANLARDILSITDNLTRALENIPNDKDKLEPIKNLIDGLQMVQKEFSSILEKHGVRKIDSLNKKFDHNFHQAMLEVETEDEEGLVVQEIQPGYTMHERLLRPSMVGVSKKTKQVNKKE